MAKAAFQLGLQTTCSHPCQNQDASNLNQKATFCIFCRRVSLWVCKITTSASASRGNLIRVSFASSLMQNLLSISATCSCCINPKKDLPKQREFHIFGERRGRGSQKRKLITFTHSGPAWQWHAFMRDAICSWAKIQFAAPLQNSSEFSPTTRCWCDGVTPKLKSYVARLHLHLSIENTKYNQNCQSGIVPSLSALYMEDPSA